ncbi:MAG: hypothetical protein ACK5LC_00345 [Coprobacillaceae bacterium]
MPEFVIYGIAIVIIAIILWLIIVKVLKNKKVGESTTKVDIDIERLLEALGGLDNIETMEATNSKVSFIVSDIAVVQIQVLKDLGATGVVQSSQKVTAIFGKISRGIVETIEAKR